MKPIEAVIAGLGRAGWDIHWRQMMKGHPGYRVVGVVDPLPERRREAETEIGCRSYPSMDAYFRDPVGELMVIATPSAGHAAESIAGLERGLHVIVDKPMCQSLQQADAMIRAALAAGRRLTCYHPLRFERLFLAMSEVIRSGRLGRLIQITARRTQFFRRTDWVMRKLAGAGMHNVWGSHSIDQCLQLAGSPPRDVWSDLQRTVTPGEADDHAKIVLRCASGTVIDIEASNCMAFPPQPELAVAGTCGGMIATPEGVRVKWFDPAQAPAIAMQDSPVAVGRRYDNDDRLPWQEELVPFPQGRGPVAFYDRMHDAIRTGAPVPVTPESVCETIAVLVQCRSQHPQIWGDAKG